MSERELFSFRNPYFSVSVGVTLAILVLTVIAGFLVLPYAQTGIKFTNAWDAICSAAGLPRRAAPATPPAPAGRTSEVVLTSSTVSRPSQESIGRGATLAQRCAICHGPTGISRADSPNLAGQYAAVIYKQLLDFRSGARTNATMSPFAANLSDQDVADIAAYYAYLPRLPAYHPEPQLPKPHVVIYGAPMRGIAPRRAIRSVPEGPTPRVRLGRTPQRHQRADAQHRAGADAAGDRRSGRILRFPTGGSRQIGRLKRT
jgi:cytochrome c553